MTVTDTLPAGLAPTAADSGTLSGWSVSTSGPIITATRGDILAGGGTYPALVLTVSVSDIAPANVTNSATVAGGGELNTGNESTSDPTTITQVADLTIAKSHAGTFHAGDGAALFDYGEQYRPRANRRQPGDRDRYIADRPGTDDRGQRHGERLDRFLQRSDGYRHPQGRAKRRHKLPASQGHCQRGQQRRAPCHQHCHGRGGRRSQHRQRHRQRSDSHHAEGRFGNRREPRRNASARERPPDFSP